MDLRQIEVFCKVVELKSFSRAAEAVLLAQPTVSAHIKALEGELGCRLLDRLGKQAVPTRAGQLLHRYASQILALHGEAQKAIHHFLGKMIGELVIGASTIPGEYLLPGLLGRFKGLYPGIAVTLIIRDTARILTLAQEGQVEIGIVGARQRDEKLRFRRFLKDELILILPPGHRWAARREVALADLREEPFVIREKGSGSRAALQAALAQAGMRLPEMQILTEMGSTEALKQAVRAGLGVAFVSRRAVQEELSRGALVTVPVHGLRVLRDFYIATHAGRTRSPLAEAFLQFVLKGCSD
ncbi:MAG: LysR family transcriptional regulator [Deltaproteobacteria bacterium]|nr:LysR family transcriptional regulator [Deltaproteobacteria bacterium]MBI3076768.1 LysR family transcriptional regulator [Deltaproteobacteria bacterium]